MGTRNEVRKAILDNLETNEIISYMGIRRIMDEYNVQKGYFSKILEPLIRDGYIERLASG